MRPDFNRFHLPLTLTLAALVLCSASAATAAEPAAAGKSSPAPVYGANWKQAFKYSSDNLRKFSFSRSVTPVWIGKTDAFIYSYRTAKGTRYYRVDPAKKRKTDLFDHAKMAAQLSAQSRKPVEAHQISLSRLKIDDKGTQLKFVYESYYYEFDLASGKLKQGKKATASSRLQQTLERLEQRLKAGQISKELYDRYKRFLMERMRRGGTTSTRTGTRSKTSTRKTGTGSKTSTRRRSRTSGAASPDRKHLAYAYKHNLYVVPVDKKRKEGQPLQLTKDGKEDYGFGGSTRKSRPRRLVWSKDSKAFYVTRSDARGVKELWLVNSLSQPRPTLTKYSYSMPGEPNIRKSELYYYRIDQKQLQRVEPKWKDESYIGVHWGKTSNELRFIRQDRLRRNIELCSLNLKTGATKCVVADGFDATIVHYQSPRYIDGTDDMLWWSERTGWGHYYLYSRDGKLKNTVTSGPWRASRIVSVDPKKQLIYFYGNAREQGENLYYQHLYRVHFDGSQLTCLDPGNAYHQSSLSPTKRYVVDNCSRIDMAPRSLLRNAAGEAIMTLEEADLSKLYEYGWKMPSTFAVKAADGVTNLYGNMWKPFDFDPNKKYPVIANVYPGPQQEGVSYSFSALSSRQQLAQLGFIVIQVGHRGGAPTRSKAYHKHSYFNMRDFGLADKKAAIEQLAQRHSFIDIERVGIYGHSGGGFMSAAAVLQKPYNEFFKAAVASAGNHDNNVYNHSWAERYHGLKQVPVKKEDAAAKKKAAAKSRAAQKTSMLDDVERFLNADVDGVSEAEFEELILPFEFEPDGKGRKAVKAAKPKRGQKKAVKAKKPPKTTGNKTKPKKDTAKKTGTKKTGTDKKSTTKKDTSTKTKDTSKTKTEKPKTKFEIKVPTNAELAANLKGHLLLVHGEVDNNVHPANTYRLADALIKANKRFDMLILPGKRHSFGSYTPYFQQRMWEFFAAHLLKDRQTGADIYDKKATNNQRVK